MAEVADAEGPVVSVFSEEARPYPPEAADAVIPGEGTDGAPPTAPVGGHGVPSIPLLKFDEATGRPIMCEEGMEVLARLPGPVCPIAFVGDGRSGKSYLASKIAGEGVFVQDDSDVAVTEGIDITVLPNHPGHLLIMDCEGGNNAMSNSRAIVTVVGALVATALIFVVDGKASESSIETLAHMLEERSLIKCDGTGSLQKQTLLFVVNQNRLRYDEEALEKILALRNPKEPEKGQLRELITNVYSEERRKFFTIPADDKAGFEEKWTKLQEELVEAAVPLAMGKLWMSGSQVAQMLKRVQAEIMKHGKVSLPSLHRHVILDTWLNPKVGQVLANGLHNLVRAQMSEETQIAVSRVGAVKAVCQECHAEDVEGWCDPDIDDFFCVECWKKFSPDVLKCGFCNGFHPWPLGRVEQATKQWHCIDCLLQLGIDVE